jgi:hypothetical protein
LVEGALEDLSLPLDFLGETRLNSSSAFVFPLLNYLSNIKTRVVTQVLFFHRVVWRWKKKIEL